MRSARPPRQLSEVFGPISTAKCGRQIDIKLVGLPTGEESRSVDVCFCSHTKCLALYEGTRADFAAYNTIHKTLANKSYIHTCPYMRIKHPQARRFTIRAQIASNMYRYKYILYCVSNYARGFRADVSVRTRTGSTAKRGHEQPRQECRRNRHLNVQQNIRTHKNHTYIRAHNTEHTTREEMTTTTRERRRGWLAGCVWPLVDSRMIYDVIVREIWKHIFVRVCERDRALVLTESANK